MNGARDHMLAEVERMARYNEHPLRDELGAMLGDRREAPSTDEQDRWTDLLLTHPIAIIGAGRCDCSEYRMAGGATNMGPTPAPVTCTPERRF